MKRKDRIDWKAEVLLTTQHGPDMAQEMTDHQTCQADTKDTLFEIVKQQLSNMSNGLTPDSTPVTRSGKPLTALHFSILVTRRSN